MSSRVLRSDSCAVTYLLPIDSVIQHGPGREKTNVGSGQTQSKQDLPENDDHHMPIDSASDRREFFRHAVRHVRPDAADARDRAAPAMRCEMPPIDDREAERYGTGHATPAAPRAWRR